MLFRSGKGAETRTTSLFLGREQQQFDLSTSARHKAPMTRSSLLTKGVLAAKAKTLSRGLISIAENAGQSSGYEHQDTLLLSEQAEADAIPDLEIHNNDVRCTHGTAVGHLDEDQRHYLMTRGLSREEATRLMVEGYFDEVLQELPPNLKSTIAPALQSVVEEVL